MEAIFDKPTFKILNTSSNYNRMTFLVEGLPEGRAETLAVALRRNLIGCIPGLAPTAMQILGVNHAYDTAKGFLMDTSIISILIKSLRVRSIDPNTGDVPNYVVLEIDKTYTNESVKFGDFKLAKEYNHLDMQVMNPDEILTYIGSEDVPVRIQVLLELGIGYSPYNALNKAEDIPAEFKDSIKVDSLYSPIKDVMYEVKDQTPSEHLDSIVLTVETDGTIGPLDAVMKAAETLRADAEMMRDLFDVHVMYNQAELEKKFDTETSRPNEVSDDSEIELITLPTDLYDLLKDKSLNTIKALKDALFSDTQVQSLGEMKADPELEQNREEIITYLRKAGLELEEDTANKE